MRVMALIAAAAAVNLGRHHRHHDEKYMVALSAMGIDKADLMQEQGAHWRKAWPEGAIDNGHEDDAIMNLGRNGKKKIKREVNKYVPKEWTLDSDVVDTQKHLDDIEAEFKEPLSVKGYQDRGYAILNSGDAAIKSTYL